MSSRHPIFVWRYACLNRPKHQSGENFVCPTIRNDVIVSFRPTKTCQARYCMTNRFLPRAHAQGVKQSVCPSIIIVVVGTKIVRSRVLGVYARCKHNQSIDIGEKLVCMGFEFLKKSYYCYKLCIFCSTCLWFIDHTHSSSMLCDCACMLKLSIGKGRQVINQLCCSVAVLRCSTWLQSARGMCSTEL